MANNVLRFATLGAVIAFSSGSYAAEENCLQLLTNYDASAVVDANAATDMQIKSATEMFRNVMKSAEKAKSCYAVKVAGVSSPEAAEALRLEAVEAARIFRLAQTQFEASLDDISASTLAEVAPAAGPDSLMGMGDDMAVSSMEQLFDSYMVLEQSQEMNAGLAKISAK